MNTDNKQNDCPIRVHPCSSVVSMLSSCPSWISPFVGSFLLWAAFPPLDCWPLAWIAPIPWLLWIRRETLPGRRPYRTLFCAGLCLWLGILHFLRLPHWATSFGWLALSFYFAFYLPLFVRLSRVAVHRLRVPLILAAPLVWTGLELVRAHFLTGMSLALLGHTQYRWLELIQVSDFAGAFGVSFVVMFVAACLARMLPCHNSGIESQAVAQALHPSPASGRGTGDEGVCKKPPIPSSDQCKNAHPERGWGHWAAWPIVPAVALLAAASLYGHFRLEEELGEPGPQIALIQGSIDTQLRYDPTMADRISREYSTLSREAVEENRHLDLVVWPETMFLGTLYTFDADAAPPPELQGTDAESPETWPKWAESGPAAMARFAESLGTPLLLGVDAIHVTADGVKRFNSAAFVTRDGRLVDRYDKRHLVMFGEYVPLADHFPWLQRLTPLPSSAQAGTRAVGFDLGSVRLAPNICYESVLSHVIRDQVRSLAAEGHEPDILINLTNDGWFWGSSALDLHLICGVFRAVECRKPFLVAANTGLSASIDSNGRILEQGPRRASKVLIAQPRLDRRHSWYLAYGDWFAGVCLIASVLFGLAGLRLPK